MARKVFISSDMSINKKLGIIAETDQLAALLWPWFLTAFDDWGRAEADSWELRVKVFPVNELVTREVIEQAIELYGQAGLMWLYEESGKSYMAIPPEKWFEYQTHIRREKRDNPEGSRFPVPPQQREDASDCAKVREGARENIPSPSPSPSPSDNRSSSKTKKASHPDGYTDDFEEFWMRYPRHVAKREAYAKWQARIKEGAIPSVLIAAAGHYAMDCAQRDTEEKYIKHPATFLGPSKHYEDYLHPPEPPKGKIPKGIVSLQEWVNDHDKE